MSDTWNDADRGHGRGGVSMSTIAGGVFLGMWLFALTAGVIGFVIFLVIIKGSSTTSGF